MTALPLLRPRALPPGVVAGFSTRHGGVSPPPYASLNLGLGTGDDPAHVHENRRRLAAALGFSVDRLVIAGQVHGTAVLTARAPGLYPGYDALVTATPGLLLCLTAADCAAVLLADAGRRVVGACHAGWRGAAGGIVGRTIRAMALLGARPEALYACVGPCISTRHFEVGPEVAARFDARYVHHPPDGTRPHVDLKAAIAGDLAAAGVTDVEVLPHCTVADNADFFSHRAGHGTTGRMMGVIGMSPPTNNP